MNNNFLKRKNNYLKNIHKLFIPLLWELFYKKFTNTTV